MKKFLLGSATLLTVITAPMAAEAQDVSVSTSIDYVTEYVFRGISLESEAIQPGAEVSVGDFSAGVWASTGLGSDSQADTDEVDFYAGYSFGLTELVSASVGGTWYHYPDAQDTFEANLGVSFDTLLSPSATAYYDFTLEAFTLEGGVSHSLPVAEKTSFDLGLTAGLVDGDGFSYEYGSASASLAYAFTDAVSAYVGGNFVVNSEDALDFEDFIQGLPQSDNIFFFGTGISAGF